ncbi:ABC transporter permease subunit [Guptibacillus hwajinpoensis]|uniref:ABC transporter permease subunit n=1 Tax=Guptibacillus hwajinpoensis TaxID=208199 RepID=UPI00384A9BDD
MKKSLTLQIAFQFLLTSIGILLIGSLPYLFFNMKSQLNVLKMIDNNSLNNTSFLYDTIALNFDAYFHHMLHLLNVILTGNTIEYYVRGRELPLFPEFMDVYLTSMFYLIISIVLALILGIFLTLLTMLLPVHKRTLPKAFLFIIESLPDIFVILIAQLVIIWVYKKTNFLLFNISSGFDENAIVLPVLVLSLLPGIYIYKYLLLSFEEEEKLLYVELARGKGLKRSRILVLHVFRNSILTLFNHFKGVFLFAIANLLMLEIIFNIKGFMTFIFENGVLNPEILTIGLFMVFIPSFIMFTTGKVTLEHYFNIGGKNI